MRKFKDILIVFLMVFLFLPVISWADACDDDYYKEAEQIACCNVDEVITRVTTYVWQSEYKVEVDIKNYDWGHACTDLALMQDFSVGVLVYSERYSRWWGWYDKKQVGIGWGDFSTTENFNIHIPDNKLSYGKNKISIEIWIFKAYTDYRGNAYLWTSANPINKTVGYLYK